MNQPVKDLLTDILNSKVALKYRVRCAVLLLTTPEEPVPVPAPGKIFVSPSGVTSDVIITLWYYCYSREMLMPKGSLAINRPLYNEICNLLTATRKIDAIRYLRNSTQLGLKEAKETIDGWNFNL